MSTSRSDPRAFGGPDAPNAGSQPSGPASAPGPDPRSTGHAGASNVDAPAFAGRRIPGPPRQPSDDTPAQPYWLFETGTGPCVLRADAVRHCIEHATVMGLPTAGPRFDAAIVHESNQMMPAIDLRARRGEPDSRTDALVLRHRAPIGLVVDRIVGTVDLTSRQVHALNATQREQLAEYFSAVAFLDAKPIAVLDPERLFAEGDLPEKADVSRRLDRRKKPRQDRDPS